VRDTSDIMSVLPGRVRSLMGESDPRCARKFSYAKHVISRRSARRGAQADLHDSIKGSRQCGVEALPVIYKAAAKRMQGGAQQVFSQ